MKAKRFYCLRLNVMLGNVSPLGSREGQGEGCEYNPSLHEGLPALPNGACWALNEPFLSSGCFKRKKKFL